LPLYFYGENAQQYLPKAISGLIAVFLGFLSFSANAQINVKAGYSFSLVHDDAIDQLVDEGQPGQ
jgi:hypothetical protein